jgi:hypothetical protein
VTGNVVGTKADRNESSDDHYRSFNEKFLNMEFLIPN